MIRLEDSIEINVPLDELYNWLLKLDENFVPWSPYHTSFEKLTGGWDVGDEIQFKEIVKGVTYDIKGLSGDMKRCQNVFRWSLIHFPAWAKLPSLASQPLTAACLPI